MLHSPILLTALWALAILSVPLFPGNALFPGIAMAELSSIRPGETSPANRRGGIGGSVSGGRAASSSIPGLLPGEEIILGKCLRFSVRGFSDRSGALAHADWVNVRVRNQCPKLRRHLLVALVLIDALGASYGGPVWVLKRGEILPPGGTKTGNFPLPDSGDRMPVRWAARLLKVQRPRPPGARLAQAQSTRAAPNRGAHAPRVAARRPAGRVTAPVRLKSPSRRVHPVRPVQEKKVRMSRSALPFAVKANKAAARPSPAARQGRKSPPQRGHQRPAKKKWWQ